MLIKNKDNNIKLYYDLMLIKKQLNNNIKLYVVDEKYDKDFLDVFNIKSCMAFTIIKNQSNEKVFNEIKSKISQYEIINNFPEINFKKQIINNKIKA